MIRRFVAVTALTLAMSSAAHAFAFPDGGAFQRFLGRFGTLEADGRARQACVCRDTGSYHNAAGYLDFWYLQAENHFRTRCLIPRPSPANGTIGSYHMCQGFDVLS